MILKCRCKSEYQDKLYGPGMRVHNRTNKSDGAMQRCTVCTNEQVALTPGKAKAKVKVEVKEKSKEKGK